MRETMDQDHSTLREQLKQVLHDGIDYLTSSLTLLQTRLAALAMSSALFFGLLILSGLLALAAFILLTVAFGLWLAHLTNSGAISLLIIGGIYILISALAGSKALRWLKNIKS